MSEDKAMQARELIRLAGMKQEYGTWRRASPLRFASNRMYVKILTIDA